MKNIFKFAAVAVIASMTLVACNNNKPAVEEDTTDTTQIEQCCDEMTMDTVADTVATVEEETPAAPAPKKTTVKKAAEKPTVTAPSSDAKQTTINPATPKVDNPDEAKKTTTVKRRGAK